MPSRGPKIAVLGGGLAGLEFAVQAAGRGAHVIVFEPGHQIRRRHVDWDTRTHPGDEKVQPWTSANWGVGGGLSHRLGGRSLCYHGVLLGLEPAALQSWGPTWARRLPRLYEQILDRLRPDFPELSTAQYHPQCDTLGLRHAPQAARLGPAGAFEAYTPLFHVSAQVEAGRLTIIRDRIDAVVAERGGWSVETAIVESNLQHSGFDAVVLSASAISNLQILANSVERPLTSHVTDHFCVGAFLRLPPGRPLAPFRHAMLWSGYSPEPEHGMNLFVLERPPLPNGDRMVQLQYVVEQQSGRAGFSHVTSAPGETYIRGQSSASDTARLDSARARLRAWAERLADGAVAEMAPTDMEHATSWPAHDAARDLIATRAKAGGYAVYDVPYGSFEHEACTHPIGSDVLLKRRPKSESRLSTSETVVSAHALGVTQDLEIAEMPGVYVLGPGAFPRLGAANPALTILALSRWLADALTAPFAERR